MSKALSASLEVPSSPGTYTAALEGLTGVNEVLMRRDPSIPPLYSTGVQWEVRQGDPSETRWRYAPDVALEGWGDCQDLSAYRAAELRVSGADPAAHVRVYPTGPNRYHAVVARGDGTVEDPSAILGMDPIPEAPVMTTQLPVVAGIGASPMTEAAHQLFSHLRALHPNISAPGALGNETGYSPKLARIRDVAPEVSGPTFHVAPHRVNGGEVCGWKGVHRVPLKDGTAIVGMTRTYSDPCDVIGDGPGLMTRVGNLILSHPIVSALISPEVYLTTRALMDPGTQSALNATGDAAKSAAKSSNDGWPSVWGWTSKYKGKVPAAQQTRGQNQAAALIDPTTGKLIPGASGTPAGAPGSFNPPGTPPGWNPSMGPPGSFSTAAVPFGQPFGGMGINPMTGQPFPPGTTPLGMQSAYQAAAAQQSGGGGGGGGGGYGADYGLPPIPNVGPSPGFDGGGGYGGFSGDYGGDFSGLSSADESAYDSYSDPLAAPGYWNT